MSDVPPPLPKRGTPRGAERRRSPRVHIPAGQARVRVLSPRSASGGAIDLSVSGMLLDIGRPLIPIGKEVQLNVRLPGSSTDLTMRAEVIRHDGDQRMGLRFLRLSQEEVARIQAFLDAT